MRESEISEAIGRYRQRNSLSEWKPKGALIDMDGVLYDSMPGHARAWRRMMLAQGLDIPEQEFFLYEGMTGRATIEMLFSRHLGVIPTKEDTERLYALKSEYFLEEGERKPMPGAGEMLRILIDAGLKRVLVTGSAQKNLLASLDRDYPMAFAGDMRVTAMDVKHGKPHPEPYLKGLEKAGLRPSEAIVIENAPLGVQAGHASGCFTVALTTGPIPAEALAEAGADLVLPSMQAFADALPQIIRER